MLFGIRDCFDYLECDNCGVLQLMNIPKDLNKYYPSSYYSYLNTSGLINKTINYFLYKMYDYTIFDKSLLGKNLLKFDSEDKFFTVNQIGKLIKQLLDSRDFNKDSYVLDVGCGAGQFLEIFDKLGFKNLYGIDISVEDNKSNINFIESTLDSYDTNLKFDLIFLNDSFEHMDNQLENMEHLKYLLKEKGRIILTMPLKSYTYEKYGSNWYALDAPRHFYIHTLKSFKILLNTVGFEIEDIIFNSNVTSFVRSEEYKNNIPENDKKAYKEEWRIFFNMTNLRKSIFDKYQIIKFKNKVKELDKKNLGDHAIFVLK